MTKSLRRFSGCSCLLWTLAAAAVAQGQDVLDNVPPGALAAVVIRNLDGVQEKIGQSAGPNAAASIVPMMDVLLKAIDPNGGIDRRGDFLFVAQASERPLAESPLCLWLPVSDYGRFVRGLGGKPEDRITVITVLGEDVLCARHREKWALVMDADQRQQLEQVLSREPNPPPRLAAFREWLASNPIGLIVFPTPNARSRLQNWLQAGAEATVDAKTDEDVLRARRESNPAELDGVTRLRRLVSHVMATCPKLAGLAFQAEIVAVGVRADEGGNLLAGLRLAWPADVWSGGDTAEPESPALHRAGEFTFSGGGRFPRPMAEAIAESFLRQAVDEMRQDNPRTTFDGKLVDQFVAACLETAAQVSAASVYHTPGTEKDGVFTNHFLAVRVGSAEAFAGQISRAVEVWNELSKTAQPSTQSMFETETITIEGRKASQYTLDIAASEGFDIAEPHMRELMERLFGPDRKLHRLVIPIDERTVLLGGATAEQAAAAIKSLSSSPATAWNEPNVAAANRLLPAEADWRLFFSPNTYTKWLKRTSLVTHGEIVGGTPLEQFADTPPVAFAGAFPPGALSVDAVIPAPTLREGAAYFNRRWAHQESAR